MTRTMRLALLAAALLCAGGCLRTGYYHTHPVACPDGVVRTMRHWHADTGYAGYHPHPFPNDVHKELMMNERYAFHPDRLPRDGDEDD